MIDYSAKFQETESGIVVCPCVIVLFAFILFSFVFCYVFLSLLFCSSNLDEFSLATGLFNDRL